MKIIPILPLLAFIYKGKTQAFPLKSSPRKATRSPHLRGKAIEDENHERRRIVVVGGGIGGISSAYDAKHLLGMDNDIILVSDEPLFSFVPSNPWIATRKRKPSDIQVSLNEVLPRHGIQFLHAAAVGLKPSSNELELENGDLVSYDYLVIATGPRLAFDQIEGLKEYGASVCTTPHALHTAEEIDKLVQEPGPVVVGAVQGASCFGPAYEFMFLLQHELKRRGGQALVDKCPMTYVSPEPEVGHLGLNGAGDSKQIMKQLCRDSGVDVICQAQTTKVTKHSVFIEQLNDAGDVVQAKEIPSKLTMLIPPFEGKECWKKVPGLTDTKGLIVVDEHQQSPAYSNIFAVGVAVSMPSPMSSVLPIGVPKTGFLIESQGSAAVRNIKTLLDWHRKVPQVEKRASGSQVPLLPQLKSKSLNNALCITDFGDDGAIFIALPQVPPRRHDWTIHSKLATLAKIAFEKYFLHKVDSGDTDPYYEKYMLRLIGVDRTIETAPS